MAAFAARILATLSHLRLSSPLSRRRHIAIRFPPSSNPMRFRSALASSRFVWNDFHRVAEESRDGDDPSDLRGYFDRVGACNRGWEMKSKFVPFVIEDQIVGYLHKDFINHLRKFHDIFTFDPGNNGSDVGCHITLHSSLKTPEDRTGAVGDVIKCLGKLIPGIRNELFSVTSSFGMPIFFSLERAAAPYFGIKAYGVQMNGYVERDGEKFLWIGKRSDLKPTYPGMLDNLVAGGLVCDQLSFCILLAPVLCYYAYKVDLQNIVYGFHKFWYFLPY